jgi:hypothetical protein
MTQGTIEIAATVEGYYPASDCTYDVTISKGAIKTHLFFYGDTETWKSFGEQLIAFPQHIEDYPTFVMGDDESFIPLLVLTAYCYNAQGHAALRVVTDNKESNPDLCRLEFSVKAEVASINRLGKLLSSWQVEDGSEIVWEAQIS